MENRFFSMSVTAATIGNTLFFSQHCCRQENKLASVATEPRSYPSSLEQRLTNPLEAVHAGVKSGGNQTQLYLSQREPARLQGGCTMD